MRALGAERIEEHLSSYCQEQSNKRGHSIDDTHFILFVGKQYYTQSLLAANSREEQVFEQFSFTKVVWNFDCVGNEQDIIRLLDNLLVPTVQHPTLTFHNHRMKWRMWKHGKCVFHRQHRRLVNVVALPRSTSRATTVDSAIDVED